MFEERDIFSISIPDHGWIQGVSGSFSCEIICRVNLFPGPLVHNNFYIYRHIIDCEWSGLKNALLLALIAGSLVV